MSYEKWAADNGIDKDGTAGDVLDIVDFRTLLREAWETGAKEERKRYENSQIAFMDTRVALGICALYEEDFPALYALQGQKVRLVIEE